MGADTISLSGLEKDVYEKAISEGVNNAFDLKEFFTLKEADCTGGGGQVWNHHHGRNVSPFFANEDSAYPVAGNQNSSKGRIGIKKVMGRIRMTEEAMDDLVSSEASFRNGMTDEKTRLIDDLARHENHALGMDGRGVLALVKEFAKQWIEDWFEPARRRITASTLGQHRPVPSGKDRGLVTQGEKKIDVNDAKAVEDILVAGFRERGGAFTR